MPIAMLETGFAMHKLPIIWLFTTGFCIAQAVENCCSVAITVRNPEQQPVADASILIESGAIRYHGLSNSQGDWTLLIRTPGNYRATASAMGFGDKTVEFRVKRDETAKLLIVL